MMIADIYKTVAARLREAGMRQATWQLGQLTDAAGHHEQVFPLALVEFQEIAWDAPSTGGCQLGEALIAVTVATNRAGDFDDGSHSQDIALSGVVLVQDVHPWLAGLAGDGWGPLVLRQTILDHNAGPVEGHVLVYACQLQAAPREPVLVTVTNIVVTGDVDHAPPPNAEVD